MLITVLRKQTLRRQSKLHVALHPSTPASLVEVDPNAVQIAPNRCIPAHFFRSRHQTETAPICLIQAHQLDRNHVNLGRSCPSIVAQFEGMLVDVAPEWPNSDELMPIPVALRPDSLEFGECRPESARHSSMLARNGPLRGDADRNSGNKQMRSFRKMPKITYQSIVCTCTTSAHALTNARPDTRVDYDMNSYVPAHLCYAWNSTYNTLRVKARCKQSGKRQQR